MSHSMKTLVLMFLQNLPELKEQQFNEAYELYKKSEGKNISVERKLNVVGYTENGLQNLLYDLQQIHNISDVDVVEKATINLVPDIDQHEVFGAQILTGQEDENGFLSIVGEEDLKSASVDEVVPLRQEFPFLDQPDCPDVFFIVIGKKISAYKRWQDAHAKLQLIATGELECDEEEKKETAALAESSYRENQEFWAELNHFNSTGEILGKHSLFAETIAKKEVEEMTPEQLSKFRGSSSKYFTDQKKALVTHKDNPEKLEEVNERIELRKFKLALVNAKLGIKDGAK